MGKQCIGYHVATTPRDIQRPAEIDGVPQHDGGGDEGEAAGAVLLSLGRSVVQSPEAVETYSAAQRIVTLALVEFRRGLSAELRLLQPVQGVQCSFDAPDLSQRQCQPVLPWISPKALEYQRGADCARAHRCREPQHVVPLFGNQLFVRTSCDERRERGPCRGRLECIKLAVGKVGDPRGEVKTQKVRQGKDVIADTPAIRVVDGDAEIRFVIEQAVDDVCRLSRGRD